VIGRTPALYRMSASAFRGVWPLLRRSLPLAALAGLLAAIAGGALSAAVAAARPDTYVAAAVFELVDHVHDGNTLSLNRSILAEQSIEYLRRGAADEIAQKAAGGSDVEGEWVVGPGFGELSYRLSSSDARAASAAATAVYDAAGFLGFGLMPASPQLERPALDLLQVQKAAPAQKSGAVTAAAGAVFGGFAGFALALLVAVPMRRREPTA
jgi:hypothetical protein